MFEVAEAVQSVFLDIFVFSLRHETRGDFAQPARYIHNVMEMMLLRLEVLLVQLHEQLVVRPDQRFQHMCVSGRCCRPRSQYPDDVPESAGTLALYRETYFAAKMFEQQYHYRHHR